MGIKLKTNSNYLLCPFTYLLVAYIKPTYPILIRLTLHLSMLADLPCPYIHRPTLHLSDLPYTCAYQPTYPILVCVPPTYPTLVGRYSGYRHHGHCSHRARRRYKHYNNRCKCWPTYPILVGTYETHLPYTRPSQPTYPTRLSPYGTSVGTMSADLPYTSPLPGQ